MQQDVVQVVASYTDEPRETIRADDLLLEDLGIDSIAMVGLLDSLVQQGVLVDVDSLAVVQTVGDLSSAAKRIVGER